MKTIIPNGYSIADREKIFGPAGDKSPAARHAEQQKYRSAKRSTARGLSKEKKSKNKKKH